MLGDRVNPLAETWMGYPVTYPALKHSALPRYDKLAGDGEG